MTVDEAVALVKTLSSIDYTTLVDELESLDVIQELGAAQDVANLAAKFFPEAEYIADAAELLTMIEKARREGLWAPGQPEDPAMQAKEGPKH